jgi:hypothetical protein
VWRKHPSHGLSELGECGGKASTARWPRSPPCSAAAEARFGTTTKRGGFVVCGFARCGVARVLVDAEHLWMVLLVVLGQHDAGLPGSVCDCPPADRAAHEWKLGHSDRMAPGSGVAHRVHSASRKPLLPAPGRRRRANAAAGSAGRRSAPASLAVQRLDGLERLEGAVETQRPQRSTRFQGQSVAIQRATASASGTSRSALSARTHDCTVTSHSSDAEGYR